jgi:hypothetical protein
VFNNEQIGASGRIQPGIKPVRKNSLLLRENVEHAHQVRAAIGRLLREQYNVAQPLPERLADLMKKIEQSSKNPHGASGGMPSYRRSAH